MELLALFTALLLVSLAASMVYRHRRTLAWDRELDHAFGTKERELPRHGRL